MFFFKTFLFKTSKENRISKYKMFVPLFRLSCCRDSQPVCILTHSNNQLYEISSTLNRLNRRMKTLAVDNPVDTSISHRTIDDHKVLQICQPRHATKFVRTDLLT